MQALTGGRQVIEGVVKSAKWVDTTAGYREISTLKMTVEMDGGQRVYGTVPAAILDALTGGVIPGGDAPRDEQLKGRRVELTATVEVSDNDPVFGFYSRPSKASLGRAGRGVTCVGGAGTDWFPLPVSRHARPVLAVRRGFCPWDRS